jgi:hypothetical protein
MHISHGFEACLYKLWHTKPHPTLYLCKIIHVFFGTGDLLIAALRKRLGLACWVGKLPRRWVTDGSCICINSHVVSVSLAGKGE